MTVSPSGHDGHDENATEPHLSGWGWDNRFGVLPRPGIDMFGFEQEAGGPPTRYRTEDGDWVVFGYPHVHLCMKQTIHWRAGRTWSAVQKRCHEWGCNRCGIWMAQRAIGQFAAVLDPDEKVWAGVGRSSLTFSDNLRQRAQRAKKDGRAHGRVCVRRRHGEVYVFSTHEMDGGTVDRLEGQWVTAEEALRMFAGEAVAYSGVAHAPTWAGTWKPKAGRRREKDEDVQGFGLHKRERKDAYRAVEREMREELGVRWSAWDGARIPRNMPVEVFDEMMGRHMSRFLVTAES